MNKSMDISTVTDYLFNCNFFAEDFDPEGKEEHLDCAEDLLSKYAWNDIYPVWNKYLRSKCKTAEEVINFCNLFSYYGGSDYYIPDAYDFLGYIYFMVDIEKNWDKAGDFLDGLCITILEKADEISLDREPYYQSWKDPKMLATIEKYKKK